VCIGLDSDRAGSRTLEKSSRRDRDQVCAKLESSLRFRGSNIKPKKKVSSMPRPRFRPRFSDLSFHLQPWLHPTTEDLGASANLFDQFCSQTRYFTAQRFSKLLF
jgi:hypothetical protein